MNVDSSSRYAIYSFRSVAFKGRGSYCHKTHEGGEGGGEEGTKSQRILAEISP